MPVVNVGVCALCQKIVYSGRPTSTYSALTPNKADLLVAFYHLGFPSATKPTAASMAAALDAGALIHDACCIKTNQVLGNALLLPEYNRLRALREGSLPAAVATGAREYCVAGAAGVAHVRVGGARY